MSFLLASRVQGWARKLRSPDVGRRDAAIVGDALDDLAQALTERATKDRDAARELERYVEDVPARLREMADKFEALQTENSELKERVEELAYEIQETHERSDI